MRSPGTKRWFALGAILIVVSSVLAWRVALSPDRRAETEAPESQERWLGHWLSDNEPLVRDYLLGLQPTQVGQSVTGVPLTDGGRLFADDVFFGAIVGLPEGVHGRLFRRGEANFACLWADTGSQPFRLPKCADPGALEHEVISRDVYAYGDLQPGGSIVIVWCPPADWAAER